MLLYEEKENISFQIKSERVITKSLSDLLSMSRILNQLLPDALSQQPPATRGHVHSTALTARVSYWLKVLDKQFKH